MGLKTFIISFFALGLDQGPINHSLQLPPVLTSRVTGTQPCTLLEKSLSLLSCCNGRAASLLQNTPQT